MGNGEHPAGPTGFSVDRTIGNAYRLLTCATAQKDDMESKSRIVKAVCEALLGDDKNAATETLLRHYAFNPQQPERRSYDRVKATAIFIRDGFIDRYSGEELVFPGALALVSRLLPEQFPLHPNWKTNSTHPAYWELFPILDHIVPIARGGPDNDGNLVTTSAIRNSAKSNWTLAELGWTLLPPGDFRVWDGLLGWFFQTIDRANFHLRDRYIVSWHAAAKKALAKLETDTASRGRIDGKSH